MTITINKITLEHSKFKVDGFEFKPSSPVDGLVAIGSHGYTSSKTSLLSWATRLASEGCSVIIFDLPGHYLGSFHEISSFSDFTSHAHELFEAAYNYLNIPAKNLILMGHSLGAFLSLKALSDTKLGKLNTINFCIGLGVYDPNKPHLMETPLYKATLKVREQLVSSNLAPDKMFQWLREQKEKVKIQDKTIFVINGQDDAVVKEEDSQRLIQHLESMGNDVVQESPKNLAHHKPELAASHIISLLKKRFQIL